MLFWMLTAVVAAVLATVGVFALPRCRTLRARGRCLSSLGAVAVILYTAIALWPWGPIGDPSSLFVFGALPIGFIPQTVGIIWCLKMMVTGTVSRSVWDWVWLVGNLALPVAYLAAFLTVGSGFWLLAIIPGACLFVSFMAGVHFLLQRDEQRA